MCTRDVHQAASSSWLVGWLVDWYLNLSFGLLKSKHLHSWLEFQQQTLRDQLARPGCPSVFSPNVLPSHTTQS